MNERTNDDAEELVLKEKIKYFYEHKTPIHITYKNGFWARGTILEIKDVFIILNENKSGRIPVWYKEIQNIAVSKVSEK